MIPVCPAVPPLYTWDSGTKNNSGTTNGTTGGTSSLKALALAVLDVPLERDKVGQVVGQSKNLVPRVKDVVGQKFPQKEKLSLEKYDPRSMNRWEAHWRACCPDYWKGCWNCPDADLQKRVFCKRHPRPAWAVLQ